MKAIKSQVLGHHFLIDFLSCDVEVINNLKKIKEHLIKAAQLAEATIVSDTFHMFSPQGVSGVVVIAESHMAIHTWPEFSCVAVDIFTCSEKMDTQKAIDYLAKAFQAKKIKIQKIERCYNQSPEATDLN